MPGYDDIVDQMQAEQGATGTSPYDDAAAQIQQQDTQTRAQTALAVGTADSNPDDAARNAAIAKRYNTTPQVVAAYPTEFKQRMATEIARDALKQAPVLQAHLAANPYTANVMHDDVVNTAALEAVMSNWNPSIGERVTGYLRNLFNLPEKEAARAQNTLAARDAGITMGQARNAMGGISEVPEQFGSKMTHAGSFGLVPDVAGDASTTAGQLAGAGGQLTGFIGGAPVKAAEGILGRVGIGALEHTAGESFAKALAKDVATGSLTLGTATALGDLGDALNTPTLSAFLQDEGKSALSGAEMGATFGAVARALPDNTVAQFLARAFANNAATDMEQGKTPFADAANWGNLTDAQKTDALFNYGLNTFFSIKGAGRVEGGWFHDLAKSEAATEDMQKFQTINSLAAASKWRERDPQGFKSFVEQVTEDGNLPNVYVDGQTFAQSMNKAGVTMDELQEKMPAVAQQVREALETQGVVRIPTADYVASVAGSPIGDELLPHLKADPEGKTFAEAQAFYQGHADALKEEAAQVAEKKQADEAWNKSAQAVHDDVLRQLNEANRFPTDVNRAYAALHRDFFNTLADKQNTTPEEAYAKHGANIVSDLLGRGGGFSQVSRDEMSRNVGREFMRMTKELGPDAFKYKDLIEDTDLEKTLNSTEGFGNDATVREVPQGESARKAADATYEITTGDGRKGYVYRFGPDVQIDVSGLKSRKSRGSAIYQAVANWSKSNGYRFEGDSQGITLAGIMRRTANMASSIARHGTSDHLYPHEHQQHPELHKDANALKMLGVKWSAGDHEKNLGELLISEYSAINRLSKEIQNVRADNNGSHFTDNDGNVLDDAGLSRILGKIEEGYERFRVPGQDGRISPVGISTLKRAAVTGEILRRSRDASGEGVRPGVGHLTDALYQAAKKEEPRSLIIQHNLSAEKLLHADRLGGLPVPSLAVTKADHPLHGFGEITLLGDRNLADPKGYAGTKVFGADIYSPRYPEISFKLDKPALDKLNEALKPYRAEGERPIYGSEINRVDDLTQVDAFRKYADEKLGTTARWHEMKALAQRMLSEAGASEHIFQGFTSSGNRKYIPHSLDNIVKLLKKELRGGESMTYGVGSVRSAYTPQFKSVEAIRNAQDRLMTKEDFEKVKEEIDNDLVALAESLKDSHPVSDRFGFLDTVAGTLYDAAKMGLPRAFKENGFTDVKPEQMENAQGFIDKLRTLPAEYFEAKILRAVDLSEFKGAVVPEGVKQEVLDALAKRGITRVEKYNPEDEADRAAKIQKLAQDADLLFQGNRGAYAPESRTIALLKDADLSTFLHETGHFFLDTYAKVAQESPEVAKDMDTLLQWFGVKDLDQWNSMTVDEQRQFHEQFAEGFEKYLMEGKAPSLELQALFSRFRAWLLNVYKSMKGIGVELTPEVRGVMDRMLASEDAIKEAETARSYKPLFTEKPEGITDADWQAYQQQGQQATDDAIADMQGRSMRDMRWLSNAKNKAIKSLQKEADDLRRELRMEVSREVWGQPVYQAWQYLKGKLDRYPSDKAPKVDRTAVDPSRDNLFTAIAKLGALNKEEVVSTWGYDPEDKLESGVFGKPVLRKEGKSLDQMAELLGEHGYLPKDEHGKVDLHDFEEKFRNGADEFSDWVDYDSAYGGEDRAAAKDAIREDVKTLGNGGRLDTDEVRRMGEDGKRVEELGMTKKGGIDAEIASEVFGFESAEDLVRSLANAEPPKVVIDAMVDQRMLERHGELSGPREIERAAESAIHNEARARFMATGLKLLAKSPVSSRMLEKGAREAAVAAVAQKKVGDINPKQYMVAERKANQEAIKLAPKDTQGAVKAQRAALLNNQLVKASLEAQDDIRKVLKYLKRFDKDSVLKNMDVDIRDQVTDLMDRFDLRQTPKDGQTKEQQNLAMWADSQKAFGYTPDIAPELLNPAFRTHYKGMTMEQFKGLYDAVRTLEHIGKERKQITIDGIKMGVRQAADEMIGKMKERGEKFTDAELVEPKRLGVDPLWQITLDRMGAALRAVRAEFTANHFKANRYDMHEIMGPFHRYLFEPVFAANYRNLDLARDVSNKFRDAAKDMGKEWQESLNDVVTNHNLMDNALKEPQKRKLTRGDLIGIALHVGNESNFEKLVHGMGWEPRDIWHALHENMREKDWQAARILGEVAGSHWDEMDAMNRRLGNTSPDRIEPRPFQTKFGEMPGWYAPVRYDPLRSRLGAKKSDASHINPSEGLFDRSYFRADTTTNGSLNARSGYHDFVDLDWHTVEQSIHDTLRDLAYREALINAHKLYIDKEFRGQFLRTYGPEEYKALGEWLGRIVNSDVGDEKSSILTKVSGATRRAMVANGIAFRISTMFKHGGSAGLKSIGYLAGGGEKYFLARVKQMGLNHGDQVVEGLAKSPELRARAQQQDRDMRERAASMMEPESLHSKAERFGHAGVAYMDFFTAVPTFHAAYDWATTEGIPKKLGGTGEPMTHADAVKWADSIVREAHGTNIEAGRSNLINNRGELVKMLTTLHGFMNNSFGQVLDAYDKARYAKEFGKPELLARFTMSQIVTGLLAGWVTFGPKVDDEPWWEWAAGAIGGEFAGLVPGLRDAYAQVVEGFDKSGMPPYMKVTSDLHTAVKDVTGENEAKHPIKDMGNVGGLFLPGLGQAGASTQFLYDEATGKQRAETVGEWLRGLMSGHAEANK